MRIRRHRNSDLTGIRINLHAVLREVLLVALLIGVRRGLAVILGELRAIRLLTRVARWLAVLVGLLKLRSINLGILTRLPVTRLVLRLKLVGVTLGRLNNKRRNTRRNRAVLVGNLHRHLKRILIRSISREGHRNHTSFRINRDVILGEALRILKGIRQRELRRLLVRVLRRQLISAERLDVIRFRVVKRRSLGLRFLTRGSLGLLVVRLPTNKHGERVSRDSLTTSPGALGVRLIAPLLLVHRVQVRRKRRRRLNTSGIQLTRRDRSVCLRGNRVTRVDNLASLLVDPLNLVQQAINPLRRQTSSLGVNLRTRLRRIITSVILEHVKNGVVRVDNVAVFQQVVLASTVDHATSPLTLTIEHVLATRQEGIVVERRELTKTLSLLRREEQPVPVHVLRNVLDPTPSNRPHPAANISGRRDLAEQVVRVVLRPIRERHLSTIVTSQVGVKKRTIIVTTVHVVGHSGIAAEGTLELQGVVAVTANSCLGSLGNPLVLAFFGHLALDPVLQRSLIPVGPTTTTDLIKPQIVRSLLIDLINRVIRQVGTIDLDTRCRHVRAVHLVHQARSKRALRVEQVPEQVALDLTRPIANHRVLISLITVHDVVAGLLTKGKPHVGHTVRTNKPTHATRGINCVRVRAHVAEVVAVQLGEVIRIRIIHPHTDLLVLRAIRVRIELHNLALRVIEGLHIDGVTTILTGHSSVHRRGDTTLLSPLRVHTHTSHRNRLPRITRVRVHGQVTITLVNHITLDRLIRPLRRIGFNRALNLGLPRGEGVALLIHHRLIDAISVLTRVLDTITGVIRLASLSRSTSIRHRSRLRRSNRLRKRCNQSNRQSCSCNRRTATASNLILLHAVKSSFHEDVLDKEKVRRHVGRSPRSAISGHSHTDFHAFKSSKDRLSPVQ